MSDIIKEVKCATCGSYIHDTERCYVWKNTVYCRTSKIWKKGCDCENCINRCLCCNYYLNNDGLCKSNHNGERCTECNEFLMGGECYWDHNKPLCQFCNLPIIISTKSCANYHDTNIICPQCELPKDCVHKHDGTKCKVCNSLLNFGKCIHKCIDGGNICIYCNIEGVYDNYCLNCRKGNSGQFTKRAIK